MSVLHCTIGMLYGAWIMHVKTWQKCPPWGGRYFKCTFWTKLCIVITYFAEMCFQWPNWKYVSIDSLKVLPPKKHQAVFEELKSLMMWYINLATGSNNSYDNKSVLFLNVIIMNSPTIHGWYFLYFSLSSNIRTSQINEINGNLSWCATNICKCWRDSQLL